MTLKINPKASVSKPVSPEEIIAKIYVFRERKVMLDSDLAFLYGVQTKILNQAVKRNMGRFPEDFMFQLTWEEVDLLKSQFVTSKVDGRGGRRKLPCVFTEQGVAMLSSVLNSPRAIHVNIEIMRTFAKIREMVLSHKELSEKIDEMEKKYDKNFALVFDAMRQLLTPPEKPKREIGFHVRD